MEELKNEIVGTIPYLAGSLSSALLGVVLLLIERWFRKKDRLKERDFELRKSRSERLFDARIKAYSGLLEYFADRFSFLKRDKGEISNQEQLNEIWEKHIRAKKILGNALLVCNNETREKIERYLNDLTSAVAYLETNKEEINNEFEKMKKEGSKFSANQSHERLRLRVAVGKLIGCEKLATEIFESLRAELKTYNDIYH